MSDFETLKEMLDRSSLSKQYLHDSFRSLGCEPTDALVVRRSVSDKTVVVFGFDKDGKLWSVHAHTLDDKTHEQDMQRLQSNEPVKTEVEAAETVAEYSSEKLEMICTVLSLVKF